MFVNCFGCGFDAEVVIRANQRWLRKIVSFFRIGRLLYVFALLQTVLMFKPFKVDVLLNDKPKKIDRCWFIVVTNHPYFGGGMKVIPCAKIEPYVFPVLIVHSVPKWKVLLLFITIFTGKHLNIKGVDLYEKVTRLTIRSEKMLPIQVDGELNFGKVFKVTKCRSAVKMQGSKSLQREYLFKKAER